MYLKFVYVEGENFQCLSKTRIDLSNKGLVSIRGTNTYEKLSSSNGSGKSSCMEMILWAIYGKTSSGIVDPTNKYSSNGCYVKLLFLSDNQEYTIIRSIKHWNYKTSLTLMKGNENISGRNKTDTDKIIRESVIPISQDIFLSTIFLSQGFSSRLSVLSPSGRKERIETLTDTSSRIEEFRDLVSSLRTKYTNDLSNIRNKISYEEGTRTANTRIANNLKDEINKANKDRPDGDLDDLKLKLSKFTEFLDSLDIKVGNINTQLQVLNGRRTDYNSDRRSLSRDNENIQREINSLKSEGICPTCKRPLNSLDDVKDHIRELLETVKSNERKIEEIDKIISELDTEISDTQSELSTIHTKKSDVGDKIRQIRELIDEISLYKDVSREKEKLRSILGDIKESDIKIVSLGKDEKVMDNNVAVSNHCLSLVTKQFRSYLLQNIIEFMNLRLSEYSHLLFSNEPDIIRLSADSSKLDISLGEQSYESLSGGEKRKVDIALVLAQRDLAMNIAGTSSNILVLDEVFDGLDSDAFSCVMNMLISVSDSVDSIFIISHRPTDEIQYDSEIVVTKGRNRISEVLVK